MNFDLDSEQAQLKAAIERLLADHYPFEARRRLRATAEGWSPPMWSRFARMGLLAAPFAEADGGLGAGAVEALVVAEALGSNLVAEPYFATVVLAGTALRLSANGALRARVVPRIAAGELILAFADDEPQARSGSTSMTTRAERLGDAWSISGRKLNVLHGAAAGQLVVTAATPDGPGIFLVDDTAPGVARRAFMGFDGLPRADITLQQTPCEPGAVLALGSAAADLIERTRQHGVAYTSSEAVGLMAMLLDDTVEHLRTRRQFGQPLGKFQALQHRCAEMLVELEQARSMALYAAMMVDERDAEARRKAFAAVKFVTGAASRFVGQQAVQLHGGLGVTDEHRVGWGLRRLTAIDLIWEDSETWPERPTAPGGFAAMAMDGGGGGHG